MNKKLGQSHAWKKVLPLVYTSLSYGIPGSLIAADKALKTSFNREKQLKKEKHPQHIYREKGKRSKMAINTVSSLGGGDNCCSET